MLIPGKLYKLKGDLNSDVKKWIFIFIEYGESPENLYPCVWFLMFDTIVWKKMYWFKELMENSFVELD